MKIIRLSFLLFLLSINIGESQVNYQKDSLHNVYLFGNLADAPDPSMFIKSIENKLRLSSSPFTIIINGDMVEPSKDTSDLSRQIQNIEEIIDIVAHLPNGKIVCIPGDRDWSHGNKRGYQQVKKLEKELKRYAKKKSISNFYWPVKKGCPGPFHISLDKHLELIALNSQWWNHDYEKPSPADATCKYSTQQDIKEELDDLIEENSNKNILIVAHHPIKSLGHYGGRFSFMDHLKPFPIIGSFKKAYQSNIGGINDLSNYRFTPYINMMENEIYLHHNLIYASSHEKNQQVIKMDENYSVNSGAIEKSGYAARDNSTEFSQKLPGIMQITYFFQGEVDIDFLSFNKKEQTLVSTYHKTLFNSACDLEAVRHPKNINLSYIPCQLGNLGADSSKTTIESEEISLAAGEHYQKGWFTKLWMGSHYRDDWSTPVRIRYLNIDTTFNGLQAKKKGGGRQTNSLKFVAQNGDFFTFRSVDKDPSKALDYRLRETIISKIFQDQTSAQQPYGALIISYLLNHLDILHASPHLYVMPDVKALGPFQSQYGGMMGLLEEHPGKKNVRGEYFANADDIVKSNKLFRKLFNKKANNIKEDEFIRARIFDILVGDWSKHEDNWKWAAYKNGDKTVYRPIPRDRDMVLSKWDGILPSFADLPFGLPNTEGFDKKISGFKSLVYQARYMDRFLTTGIPLDEYIKQAKYIQDHLSDKDIENAVAQLPVASYNISGSQIISKLKERKKDLVKYAKKYYKWLNREVEIIGSTDEDYFEIETLGNGKVQIKIFDEKKRHKGKHQYYARIFYPDQTKEIRIYGLGDKDIFKFINPYKSDIKIRLIGGKGKDNYELSGKSPKIKIYDLDNLKNENKKDLPLVDNWNLHIYEYDRNRLKFNSWVPSFVLGYTNYQGFILGGGNTWIRQRWDKNDYASRHQVNVNFSSKGDLGMQYHGRWHESLKKWDILTDVSIANPEYINSFYGLGNTTTISDSLNAQDYYLANYNGYVAKFGVAKTFWRKSELSIKTGIGVFNSSPIENSILDNGLETITGAKGTITTIPTEVNLDIDFRDHNIFPSRGVRLKTTATNYSQLNGDKGIYGSLYGSLEYYISNYSKKKATLGFKIAGSKGYGDPPYYHQASLGSSTGLRGYTSNRFTGRSMIYFNSELRLELINRKNASVPWKLGVLGFFDTGRVFIENGVENQNQQYNYGYGTGIFLIPFSRMFSMSVTLGWSDEESFYPGFTFGTSLK